MTISILNDPATRATAIKSLIAGGLGLASLVTGLEPLAAIVAGVVGGVSGELVAGIVDGAADEVSERWFTKDGALNHHIMTALSQAFREAVQQLELDWQQDDHYLSLHHSEPELAERSLELLQWLRADADTLFQDEGTLQETLESDNLLRLMGTDRTDSITKEESARQFLNQTIDDYLSEINSLAMFAKEHLADRWLFRFGEILKSEAGSPAWRACQRLWQSSLSKQVTQIQQSNANIQADMTDLRDWLGQWESRLDSLPDSEHEPTGMAALEQALAPIASRLADIKDDTSHIRQDVARLRQDMEKLLANTTPNIRKRIYDFSNLIEEKTRDFVGRAFVFQAIDAFIDNNPRGYFFIRGEPGIGKSSLSARLVSQRGYLHHFNVLGEGINKPSDFLANVCAQLIARYHLDYQSLPQGATENSNILNKLLREAVEKLSPDEKIIILVDALDESYTNSHPKGVNLLYLPTYLPDSNSRFDIFSGCFP
ncbi:hypothetical protein QUF58_09895 [Anaerolineales bacterium HSG24]|nr:hypothetical protein [Anaerolineales bacterium HSG24]